MTWEGEIEPGDTMNSVPFTSDNKGLLNFSASIHTVPSNSYFLEEVIDWMPVFFWLRKHFYLSYFCAIAYMVGIAALKSFMSNRPPMKLKNSLIIWNGALAVFSIQASCRLLPVYIRDLFYYGPYRIICMGR